MSENNIVNAIIEYLHWRKIFCWRNNNMPVYDPKSGSYRRMPKYAICGVSDITGILPDGRALYIECKVKNKKPTPAQREFMGRVNNNNGLAFMATGIDDVAKELDSILKR